MSPSQLNAELTKIGRRMSGWNSQCNAMLWAAVVLAALFAAALADTQLRFPTVARIAAWLTLIAGAAFGARRAWASHAICRPPAAVAATLEHAFPQLDNRLINYVQFAGRRDRDAMVEKYLQSEPPDCRALPLAPIKNRRRFRRTGSACLTAVVMLAIPLLWAPERWTNSVLRILNPFSSRAPIAAAYIVDVDPGDVRILQGSPLKLSCTARGQRGVAVYVELWPEDGRKSLVQIGKLREEGDNSLSYRMPKVTADMTYRFKTAGIPHRKFTVTTRAPLAVTSLRANVTPPEYMNLAPTTFDGLSEDIDLPDGSRVALSLACNFPLRSAEITTSSEDGSVALQANGSVWSASLTPDVQQRAVLTATDEDGYTVDASLRWKRLADNPPVIEITMPTGRTRLTPGQQPVIRGVVHDDFGLTAVVLEKLDPKSGRGVKQADVTGTRLTEFPVQQSEAIIDWKATSRGEEKEVRLVYRIVARDNRGDDPQVSMSPPLVFDLVSTADMRTEQEKAVAKSVATLAQLIGIQKANLGETKSLLARLDDSMRHDWDPIVSRQSDVRRMAGKLLLDTARPLGTLTPLVRKLHATDMADAIDLLERAQGAARDAQGRWMADAVTLETKILQLLTHASSGHAGASRRATITGLLAMLDALVKGEKQVLERTQLAIGSDSVAESLIDTQDELASDVVEFVRACEREARQLEASDKAFSELVTQIAGECERRKIHDNMIRAAEALDQNDTARAVPLEEKVLADLEHLHAMANRWRAEDFLEEQEDLLEAVQEYKDKIEKLRDLRAEVVEAMRELDRQEDEMGKDQDTLEEELAEINKNIKDALLTIPTDLNIFADLPVGNDLVEDVWQVFEEVEKTEDAESEDKEINEMGTMKDDALLDMLEMAAQRADEMEMWLSGAGDDTKRAMEDFDKAELENAGEMNKMPMPAAMEDLIGDLIEEAEKAKKEADDSATNQGVPDMAPGWEVAEGEFANFSAQGKSGNTAPDHKEQDGRSNIGRQGMSDGETTAGAGAINEGDEDIEKRMTQDPNQGGGKVEEENNADAVATGGGKQSSGHSEDTGMPGQGPRRDSDVGGGGQWDNYLRKTAEQLYAQASMLHVRTASLGESVEHIRQVSEAYQRGESYHQIRELQNRAIDSLKKTQAELNAGFTTVNIDTEKPLGDFDDQLSGGSDEAPEEYRDLVSQYFKALNETAP